MPTKQEQIEAKSKKPIEIGDYVRVVVKYKYPESITEGKGKNKITKVIEKDGVFRTTGTVSDIYKDTPHGVVYQVSLGSVRVPSEVDLKGFTSKYDNGNKLEHFKGENVLPSFDECGSNPFKKERFRVDFYNQDIHTIIFKAGYGKHDNNFTEPTYNVHSGTGTEHDSKFKGLTYGGVNFNPYVIDANGDKQFYQRDLVWTLEQKQLLIDSIYNGIEIGKFLFRYSSWKKMEIAMKTDGHGYSFECVDGKQRFFAILHFIQNKYPDSYGNYWDDLSPTAQNRLLNYNKLSYGEMGENAKDNDVIETFLTLNFTGTPMSKEHIEFVQSFKM